MRSKAETKGLDDDGDLYYHRRSVGDANLHAIFVVE